MFISLAAHRVFGVVLHAQRVQVFLGEYMASGVIAGGSGLRFWVTRRHHWPPLAARHDADSPERPV